MELTPLLILAMWAAGTAAGGALVAKWAIVGPGYNWLSGALCLGLGLAVYGAGGGWQGLAAAGLGLVAVALARRPTATAAVLAVASALLVWAGMSDAPLPTVAVGALFIGGVTSEMLLAHWYLVDPRLPRWSLQRLALLGGVGLLAEVALVVGRLIATGTTSESVFIWAYVALAVMTGLLIVAVWFSLAEPRYTGVMAATGLSYLAILTAFGVLYLGRYIAWG